MPVAVRVDDTKWRRIVANVAEVAKMIVKVGVLGGTEADGTPLPDIAAVHEYGAEGVPQRSFVRRTFDQRAGDLVKTCERCAKAVVVQGMPVVQALGLLGTWGAAAVKRTITAEDIPPPLAASTVAAKGSSKPLVDTGSMVNAVTWAVSERVGP